MVRFVAVVIALVVTFSGLRLAAQALDGVWEAKLGASVVTVDFDSRLISFNGAPPAPLMLVLGSDPPSVEFDVAAAKRALRFSGRRTGGTIEGAIAGQMLSLVRLPDSTPHLVGRRRYPLPAPGTDGQAIAKTRSMVDELVRTLQIPGLSVAARATALWSGPRVSALPTWSRACP